MAGIIKARTSKYMSKREQFDENDDIFESSKVTTLKRISTSKKIKSGQLGEQYAVNILEQKGYRILARNEIVSKVEIDIVAQKNDEIIFVEVRTREKNKFVSPEETITSKKTSAMLKAAKLWSNKYNYSGYFRLDLIAVTLLNGEFVDVEHYESITEPII
ncbi:MAG: YraN family protein [Synergistaceae bacterium]|nr:YraN family protein [Synergistaceae bacterium]